MIDRKAFFDAIRAGLFGGTLNDGQVEGINVILDEWEQRELTDTRWLADILGTTKIETAHTMQPVREAFWLSEDWRRANFRYYPYYGRGLVQITWEENYRKLTVLLYERFKDKYPGFDMVKDPDLALVPEIATAIMFVGMILGLFTNFSLEDFFNDHESDWVEARRIVNGTDRAEEIAEISKAFYVALGGIVTEPLPPPSTGPRDLEHGMTGADVHALQKALLAHDGNFGAQTSRALRAFQASEGLDPDGVVGLKTREALKL